MTLGTIIMYVVLLYAIYYTAVIVYELFIQPAPATPEKALEEDVDISGIAKEFAPVYIDKNNMGNPLAQPPAIGSMTGGMSVLDFVAEARKLGNNPRESAIGRISDCWTVVQTNNAA